MKDLESLAVKASLAASEYIMRRWSSFEVAFKTDKSIVTDVDIETEKLIRAMLEKESPSIEICGEELGNFECKSNSNRYWLIDPIDGTRWYALGIPLFGSLIALVEDGEPVIGVISIPATKEIIYASKGNGCYYQMASGTSRQVFTSKIKTIDTAMVSASGLHGSDVWLENGGKAYHISHLPHMSKTFLFAGDCMQHSLVARGKLDAGIDTIMKPWDSAAIIPCIKEAGGYVCCLDGKTEGILEKGTLLSCATESLAEQLLELIKPKD